MRGSTLLVLSLAVLATGCRPKANNTGSSSSTPGSSTAAQTDDFTPAVGHVNQRTATGYAAATQPPSPATISNIKPVVFSNSPPAKVKLTTPKQGKGHCGELDLGNGKKVFLDCMDADYGKVKSAATPLVSTTQLNGSSTRVLPPSVDHRQDGSEGPVLDQGSTLACTSFSLVGAVNHSISRYLGHPGNLSPMHSWSRYHAPKMALADEVNIGHGLSPFEIMPFNESLANAWQQGKSPVDPKLIATADSKATVTISNITHIEFGDIKGSLAAGQDVWFALRAAHGIQKLSKTPSGSAVVPDFDWQTMPASQQMGHAIILSGYQDTPSGTYYLIHNSWGPTWGEGGFAWIHESTLSKNITDAYVVEARPLQATDAKVPPPIHKFASCTADTAPDAVTSQCVPRCADKGPRANGVCPVASHCPAGQVNLSGHCTPSAPIGETTVNGLHVTCGASGCTYGIPKGQHDCNAANGCQVSCPSPRYRLANGPRGLACTG